MSKGFSKDGYKIFGQSINMSIVTVSDVVNLIAWSIDFTSDARVAPCPSTLILENRS